jgi:hypothetical protein
MKIFHAADIHLGRRRLEGRLPDSDFAAAFESIARVAVEEKADVFLLAGDLFDRPQVEPPHLRQAQRVLALLQEARIPVVAIEGNHDKAFISTDAPTWLEYLAQDDLLILLKTAFDVNGAILTSWDATRRRGSQIEIGGVVFTGAGYLGAATPHKVRQIVERLEPGRCHGLLLHAGPDYFVGEGGGFSAEDLRAIHEKVRYLALGHIHKPMLHGGWACNPGSPENCELREAAYDRDRTGAAVARGFAVIQLDPSAPDQPVRVTIRSNPRRPCVALDLDCTPFGNKLKNGAAALEKAAVKLIEANLVVADAAIELRLGGRVDLDRIAFEAETVSRNIEQATGAAAVFINAAGLNLEAPGGLGGGEDLATTREELERAALRVLVAGDHFWGIEGEQEAAVSLFFDLKDAVQLGRSPAEMAETIRTSALVDRVRLACEVAEPVAEEGALPA